MKTIATFEINYFQFLDKEGNVVAPLPAFATKENLISMYRAMQLTRLLDSKAVNLQRMGKLGTYPSSLGQEAVSVGMAYAMQNDDVLVPYYRDQGAMLKRGVSVAEILNYWGGDERANNYASTTAKKDFPIPIPVGSQNLHAAGAAYALKYHQKKQAVVCGCGDGGTSEGDFYEAINFAGVYTLPVVFVINNNQWAISVPRHLQTAAATIAQKGIAAGIRCVQVDGNDVIAVQFVVAEALAKARNNEGATLVEAVTYRLCDHTTADDARRYCDEKEVQHARENEPIKRLQLYFSKQGWWSEAEEKKLIESCTAEIDQGIQTYLNTPPPTLTDMFDYLYETLPQELQSQRDSLKRK